MAYVFYPSWLSPEIIPGLPFRWYSLMYLVAFAIAYVLMAHQVRERRLPVTTDELLNFFFWGIVGLLLGARIFAALVYDPSGTYLRNPLLIFWPFDEHGRFVGLRGMSYHGGLIGGTLGVLLYCLRHKKDVLEWGDMLTASIPLGYTFGRLGNFINGELYGRVSALPWAMIFPEAERFPAKESWVQEFAQRTGFPLPSSNVLVNLPRHPSQLYEAFFEGIVLWALLWFLVRPRRPFKGAVLAWYLVGYGGFRFVLEYFRQPDAGIGFPLMLEPSKANPHLLLSPFNFTTGQILSFFMVLAGVILLLVLPRMQGRTRRKGTASHTE
ncbi:prolipoprotein diacylglyceryl transferase [Spirochaeta thermophila]|uniref:Phosphatidylglycerol--prolipoprotein diacylglyceryl transferase n=1 Tax=Winmispira thermophila (strain ATCC 49972 / DSM 6192 / RI 19.B1) TaxID=665571 RepID=E0RTE5_WINT6|nr:prolipoprotein diacylglyceryl transferase [Spirochaeta thermophila]ADN01011.1 prolipoprotein diacylglyceryl transferase [Spirochaeta thermophila DSM 6192]